MIHQLRLWALGAFLCLPALLTASVISGNVKDPSGGLVPGAVIQISSSQLAQPLVVTADDHGHFTTPDLAPGSYSLRATATGFDVLTSEAQVGDSAVMLDLQLSVAEARQEVAVAGKAAQFVNSDPVYKQLRAAGLGQTYPIEKLKLQIDAGTFHLKGGTVSLIAPVAGQVTGAVYVGQGHFSLKPVTEIDTRELRRRIKADSIEEDFDSVVFRFSPGPEQSFVAGAKGGPSSAAPPAAAISLFHDWQAKVRQRHEVPLSYADELLHGDQIDNIDAELLGYLYNPTRPMLFEAFIHSEHHRDLRLYVKYHGGVLAGLNSPEEVAVINDNPNSLDDGVWYLAHVTNEFQAGTANSQEEKRFVSAQSYKIETVVGANNHLTSVSRIQLKAVLPGERVLRFGLLPNLRVTRVADAESKDLSFIQEGRRADGSFYAILPAPLKAGETCTITVEYAGDKVLTAAGSGSFYVGAREAWYPALNSFSERSLYDLTFRVPKKYRLISIGSLDHEGIEDNFYVSHWVTATPVAVAGFNYGNYQHVSIPDETYHYRIDGYYLPDLPDAFAKFREGALSGMAPKGMTEYALQQARAQMQVCTLFFGHGPFDRIAITEQPNFNFGQSWPTLVYLPISAYMDNTQRWMLMGHISNSLTAFVQEVTPHEVSHQWWGHAVNWASYHDQWLSEGFAEFSAGLFLQQATGKDWQKDYTQFWERQRKRIFEKNQWGAVDNDAGPIWLGLRLMAPRSESAYQTVTYAKGAYILSMLRSIFYNTTDQDKQFIEMMHDFVASHKEKAASTESFKAIVEKHMPKYLDLQHSGRLDWFFNEWVYGTEIPHYDFDYQLSPGERGNSKLHLTLTQSQVSSQFGMFVPLFADYGKGFVRIGQLPIAGSNSRTEDFEIPGKPKKMAINAYKEILER